MTETISINVDSEYKKNIESKTGMSASDCIKLLMDNFNYGGKFGLDPFWSEENQKHLKKVAEDVKHGRNMHEHDLIEVE